MKLSKLVMFIALAGPASAAATDAANAFYKNYMDQYLRGRGISQGMVNDYLRSAQASGQVPGWLSNQAQRVDFAPVASAAQAAVAQPMQQQALAQVSQPQVADQQPKPQKQLPAQTRPGKYPLPMVTYAESTIPASVSAFATTDATVSSAEPTSTSTSSEASPTTTTTTSSSTDSNAAVTPIEGEEEFLKGDVPTSTLNSGTKTASATARATISLSPNFGVKSASGRTMHAPSWGSLVVAAGAAIFAVAAI